MLLDRRGLLTAGAAAVSLGFLGGCRGGDVPEKLILPWSHSAEYGFLYLAAKMLAAGGSPGEGARRIILELEETRGSQDVAQQLREDYSRFALISADYLIKLRAEGRRLRAIYAVYQKTPVSIVSLRQTGISNLSDLVGKRVGVVTRSTVYQQYRAALEANGVDYKAITEVEAVRGGLPQLINGDIDAVTQFTNFAPVQLKIQGKEPSEILLADNKVDMYGTCLVATEGAINSDRALCQSLVRAIQQSVQRVAGGDFAAALKALEEVTEDPGLTSFPSGEPDAQIRRTMEWIAAGEAQDISKPTRALGAMTPERWQQSMDVIIPKSPSQQPVDMPGGAPRINIMPHNLFTNEFVV